MNLGPLGLAILSQETAAGGGYDPDAEAWFAAIASAGSSISEANKAAADTHIFKAAKTLGVWDAIRSGCLFAGPDSLAGALVPFKGTDVPVGYNFSPGDQSRTLGLAANGSNKYVSTSVNNNTLAQNDCHIYARVSVVDSGSGSAGLMGTLQAQTGSMSMRRSGDSPWGYCCMRNTTVSFTTPFMGGNGMSRFDSSSFQRMTTSTASIVGSAPSQTPRDQIIDVFRTGTNYIGNTILAYSLGANLDLTVWDSCVAAYEAALT